ARRDQGHGIGVGMLQDAIRRTLAIAEQVGVRAVLTHPIDEQAARFYLRFGFEASPIREQQLLLLLKDPAKAWQREIRAPSTLRRKAVEYKDLPKLWREAGGDRQHRGAGRDRTDSRARRR